MIDTGSNLHVQIPTFMNIHSLPRGLRPKDRFQDLHEWILPLHHSTFILQGLNKWLQSTPSVIRPWTIINHPTVPQPYHKHPNISQQTLSTNAENAPSFPFILIKKCWRSWPKFIFSDVHRFWHASIRTWGKFSSWQRSWCCWWPFWWYVMMWFIAHIIYYHIRYCIIMCHLCNWHM